MNYGSITGVRSLPRGRLWVFAASAEPDAELSVRVAWNDPRTGRVDYADLGAVASARLRPKTADITLAAGGQVRMVVAPCVCGAGSVGNAPPGPDRPRMRYVYLDAHPALS